MNKDKLTCGSWRCFLFFWFASSSPACNSTENTKFYSLFSNSDPKILAEKGPSNISILECFDLFPVFKPQAWQQPRAQKHSRKRNNLFSSGGLSSDVCPAHNNQSHKATWNNHTRQERWGGAMTGKQRRRAVRDDVWNWRRRWGRLKDRSSEK